MQRRQFMSATAADGAVSVFAGDMDADGDPSTFSDGELASKISREAFERHLLVETSGPDGNVVKLMPALTIESAALLDGLDRLASAVDAAVA